MNYVHPSKSNDTIVLGWNTKNMFKRKPEDFL